MPSQKTLLTPVQKRILSFCAEQGRDLPWRKTTDPYAILVSEVMLQQTQVERVIPYYHHWLRLFPNLSSLAKAKKPDVLRAWSGLGYNSRALRLQRLAQHVVAECGGRLPETREALMKLPGIGPYTSAAILAFAFNKPAPVIDTNIRRVMISLFGLPEDIGQKDLEATVLESIPPGKSRDWFNALMDYGALELTARKTGIRPLSRQDTFAGSTRQARGNILRWLLEHGKATERELQERFSHPEMETIINRLVQEGMVSRKKGVVRLAD